MAQPTRFTISYDFQDYQSTHPSDPLPGDKIDVQFADLKTTTDEICINLALIQKDDGTLANNTVGPDQLTDDLTNLLDAVELADEIATVTALAADATLAAEEASGSADAAFASANLSSTYASVSQGYSDIAVAAAASALTMTYAGNLYVSNNFY